MRISSLPFTLLLFLTALVLLTSSACSTTVAQPVSTVSAPQPITYEISYDGTPIAEVKVTTGTSSIISVLGNASITPPRGEVSEYIINPEKGQPYLQEGSYCRIEILDNGQVAIALMNTKWTVVEK